MRDNSSRSSTNDCAATILVLQYMYDIMDMLAKINLRIEKVRSVVLDHIVDAERNRLHQGLDLLSFHTFSHTNRLGIWEYGYVVAMPVQV